jgi:hypothetical protein
MSSPTTNLEEHNEWIKTIHLLRLIVNVNHKDNKLGRRYVDSHVPHLTDAIAAILVQHHEVLAVTYTSGTDVQVVVVSVLIRRYDETETPLD